MSQMKIKEPELAFPNFSQNWEEKSLGEIGETYNGLTNKNKDDFGRGKKYIQYKQVFDSPRIVTNECSLVKTNSEEKQNKVKYGDIFFTVSSETPEEVGMASVLLNNPEEDIYLNSFCFGYRPCSSKVLNPYFCKFLFRSQVFREKVVKLAQGSTRYNLSKVSMMKIKINLPSFQEQTEIANFLTSIDEKIKRLVDEIAVFEKYKKGIMQKLFSQEIRLKDENGSDYPDWEEKMLGELCKIQTGKLDANAMVNNGQFRFYTCAKEYYKIDNYAFDTEALLVSGNGANVGYIHYFKGKFNAYQRTYVLDDFKQNIIYIKYFLEEKLAYRIAREKKEGNTPYIVLNTLSNMPIHLPSIQEQTEIANFLTSIDQEIEKVQQELEQTKLWKTGLMQKMFI